MIPKGVLRHAEISRDINRWQILTSKFGHFWPKIMDLPLGKKSIFGRNTNILLKASKRISVSENVPWDTFQACRGTRDKEIGYERWSQSESWEESFFSGHYFHFKIIPKGLFWHAQICTDKHKCKVPTSKFGHFWPKTMEKPNPWKKVHFWTKYKYSFKSFQSNQCVPKRTLGQFLGLPRDQGQRNSPLKIKSGWELNTKFFVRTLFALEKDSQRSFPTRRDPYGHKQVKNTNLKIWSFLAKNQKKKVDFWKKYKYFFKSFQLNQCVRRPLLRHLFVLSRD